MCIRDRDRIIQFFEEHRGEEFISFASSYSFQTRVQYYHIFQEICGRSRNIFLRGGNRIFLLLQRLFRIHRNKNIRFQFGSNWFSITDSLARYVVEQEKWIKKIFRYTRCCDEVFLQTLVINSKFRDHLYLKRCV